MLSDDTLKNALEVWVLDVDRRLEALRVLSVKLPVDGEAMFAIRVRCITLGDRRTVAPGPPN